MINAVGNNCLKIVRVEVDDERDTAKTTAKIQVWDKAWNFRKIIVDSGGFGCGITDELIRRMGRKILGIDNAKRTIDKDERKGKVRKEDLYSHAVVLMEKEPPRIDIIDNLKLLRSLRSMTFEYTADKNLRIFGKYSHLAEAFVRACWCLKEKGMKLYCC